MRERPSSFVAVRVLYLALCLTIVACGDTSEQADGGDAGTEPTPDTRPPDVDPPDGDSPETDAWQSLAADWPSAPLAVEGTGPDDVWVVGAHNNQTPLVRHFDGDTWTAVTLAAPDVDLWTIHPLGDRSAMVGGSDGAIFRIQDGRPTRMRTPGLARQTVYDLWGESPDDVYAVGASGQHDGFIWHFDGESWERVRLPRNMPKHPDSSTAGLFGVTGNDEGAIWAVGARGTVLRQEPGREQFRPVDLAIDQSLYAVDARSSQVVAAGGDSSAVLVRLAPDRRVTSLSLDGPLRDLSLGTRASDAMAVGADGRYAKLVDGRWRGRTNPAANVASLRGVWVDQHGETWTVGGNIGSTSLTDGAIAHTGSSAPVSPEAPQVAQPERDSSCPPTVVERASDKSIARRWIEQLLAAIRIDRPSPIEHARNLYHVSLAMFDTWAIFDRRQGPLVADASYEGPETPAARRMAVSHAAYHLLRRRYEDSPGAATTRDCLQRVMADLGYSPSGDDSEGASPRTLGRRVADTILAMGRNDGSRAYDDYTYESVNPPMNIGRPGSRADDPTHWQELLVPTSETPRGMTIERSRQTYLGPNWGKVDTFVMERPAPDQPYVEPGPFPEMGEAMDRWVLQVIRKTSQLSAADPPMIDISPAAIGNNSLAADDGDGHPVNPATGEPYDQQLVSRADYGRVLAEYWADGPNSETPPGHWNTIAHKAVDDPAFVRHISGSGERVDPLTWDVHMYLLLNGALHDAAVIGWEQKRYHESGRPITLIRWMGQEGQSSAPDKRSYDPEGLPLVDGLVEVVTPESSAPGNRHEHLAPYVGEIALLSWPGTPGNSEERSATARWIRAVEWIPYQSRTFVTPAFPGYVSGHSTFSRTGARVLHRLTGSKFFPGGLAGHTARAGETLEFENGPSRDVRLQWATYYDAADQAGRSRVWGGIHIAPDHYDGRIAGQKVGDAVWQWARRHLVRVGDDRIAEQRR